MSEEAPAGRRTRAQRPYWSQMLRALREARGITQDGWSAALGVGRTTLQRWESGETAPDSLSEDAIVAYCEERALFRRFEQGPLQGLTLTPEMLRNTLAEARLGESGSPAAIPGAPVAAAPAPATPPRRILPAPLTSFVGREYELETARDLLRDARLLTLTGPGGAGKTRLSIRLAEEVSADFEGGVYFIDLAPIVDPSLVVATIAQTLEVRETPGRGLLEALKDFLQDRHALLVLDNFEQLTEAGSIIVDILTSAPKLTVLVTSRAALRVRGEQELSVPPLAAPDPGRLPSLDDLAQFGAVSLFLQRARNVSPDFALTNDNAAAIAEICQRLDGLPLAIELAAARTKLFSPQAMLARLDQRLPLLTGGAPDLPARQRTLTAAIGWSYDLLSAKEQAYFRTLGVFSGGYTLEAASAVCAAVLGEQDEIEILDMVSSLVDRSLIRQRYQAGDGGEPRLFLLETIREYALDRLREAGEEATAHNAHRDYFLAMASAAKGELAGPTQATALAQLEREHDNLRAAYRWMFECGDMAGCVRMAESLQWFWDFRGHFSEGRALMRALRGVLTQPTALRRSACDIESTLSFSQGEPLVTRELVMEQIEISRALGDRAGEALLLTTLGSNYNHLREFDAARRVTEEGIALQRELGDDIAIGHSLMALGDLEHHMGNLARAQELWEEVVSVYRQHDDPLRVALALNNLGIVTMDRGDLDAAEAYWGEALEGTKTLGDLRAMGLVMMNLGGLSMARNAPREAHAWFGGSLKLQRAIGNRSGTAMVLGRMAGLAASQGEAQRALRLAGAADAVREAMAATPTPALLEREEREIRPAREALGESAAAEAFAIGRTMPLEHAVEDALTAPAGDSPAG